MEPDPTPEAHRPHGIHRRGTARRVHDDIEQSLRPHGKARATPPPAGAVAKRLGRVAWRLMKRHPFVTVAVVGVGAASIAAEVGAAAMAFGGAIALGAYKVLREGEPPLQAFEDAEHDVSG